MSTGPLPAVGTVYAPDVHPPPFTVSKAVALPTLVLPYPILREFIRSYGVTSLWLLRVISGIKVEWRGLDNIPKGSCIIACRSCWIW